jgi:hypothetical protein
MIRNIKIFGLVLAAALAMCSTAASIASAKIQFTASAYGTVGAKEDPVITLGASGSITCKYLEVAGQLNAPSSTMTLAPVFTECTSLGFAAAIKTNGCDFLIHADQHLSLDTYAGKLDLVCPAGKSIEIQMPFISCTATLLPGTGFPGMNLKNNTREAPKRDDIAISGTVKELKYMFHGAFCPDNTTLHSDGAIHMENHSTGAPITVTSVVNGQQVDLWLATVET